MTFEDIQHKYRITSSEFAVVEPKNVLIHICNDGREAIVGWFKDDTICRNVALALEYYKEHNKA